MTTDVASAARSSSSPQLVLLENALSSWSTFDLTDRRPHLDDTAQSLLDGKEVSAVARKRLGEATKNLKAALKNVEKLDVHNGGGGGDTGGASTAARTTTTTTTKLTAECKSTIRMYQEEIDAVTRRAKFAENAFVQLYGGLSPLPDPAYILRDARRALHGQEGQIDNLLRGMEELTVQLDDANDDRSRLTRTVKEMNDQLGAAAVAAATTTTTTAAQLQQQKRGGKEGVDGGDSSLTNAEKRELIQLRKEVAEFELEFRGLKNQDITIRKLESKIEELEANKDDEIQRELKKARDELQETEGRRTIEALEREASTTRKLESVELQLRAERAGREASANQLLRAEDGVGEREAAWEAQRHILIQDAERLREELGVVGRERDNWRLRMEALSGVGTSSSAAPTSGGLNDFGVVSGGGGGGYPADYSSERKAYEAEITELSNTCTALREELRLKDDSTLEERRSLRTTIDSLERERASLTKRVSSLEIQVTNAPSQDVIDKMRHELRILKRLEYNAVDYDHSDPEMTGKDDDLESVLVAKLRKVEADLVRERREKTEGHTARDELNQRLLNVQKELGTAQELIERLENDLQVAVATPTSFSNPTTPVRPTTSGVSTNPPDPNTLQRILDPNAPPIRSLFPQDMSGTPATTDATSSEKARDDHSVATIIMAQRDRLRSRCDALEAERDSFKRELQAQVQAAEGMKTDNTKLYEKVRYLQSFSGGSTGGAYSRGNNRASGDLDLEALEQRYEASVDPFRQFSRAERQRKFNEMSPMEKVVFIVAKTTLGSKEMRTVLFFYVLAMHLLVFVTTYTWSHSSTCDSYHNQASLAHFHGGAPPPLENVAAVDNVTGTLSEMN